MHGGRSAVPGNVGDLALVGAAVAIVGRIGVVLCLLVGIGEVGVEQHIGHRGSLHHGGDIDAAYAHLAYVHHHPSVLPRALRHGDNLVGHPVVVAVGRELHATPQALLAQALPHEAQVELAGILGLEAGIANVGVIQVVERGHAEDALVVGPHLQVGLLPGLVAQEYGRGELVEVLAVVLHGLPVVAGAVAVVGHGVEQRGLGLEPPQGVGRGQRGEHTVACGSCKVDQRGLQRVALVIDREIDIPVVDRGELACRRNINLVLGKLVVDIHQRGVGVEVAHPVAGIFCIDHELVEGAELLLPRALHKEILVPLALAVFPHVVDDGAWYATLAVVVVGLGVPLALPDETEEAALEAQGTHVAVFAHRGGVPGQRAVAVLLAQGEVILPGGIGVLGVECGTEPRPQLLLPAHAGIGQAEGAGAHGDIDVVALAGGKVGALGLDIDSAGRPEVACRLEDLALLAVVERDRLDVVERELAQVDLPVLGIAQLNAVVEHPHVIGAHRANVDGLHTAHAAVVLELHAGKVAQGIGHAVAAQPLKAAAIECLGRYHLLIGPLGIHGDIAQVLHRVEAHVAGLGFGLSHRGKAATAQQACK